MSSKHPSVPTYICPQINIKRTYCDYTPQQAQITWLVWFIQPLTACWTIQKTFLSSINIALIQNMSPYTPIITHPHMHPHMHVVYMALPLLPHLVTTVVTQSVIVYVPEAGSSQWHTTINFMSQNHLGKKKKTNIIVEKHCAGVCFH